MKRYARLPVRNFCQHTHTLTWDARGPNAENAEYVRKAEGVNLMAFRLEHPGKIIGVARPCKIKPKEEKKDV